MARAKPSTPKSSTGKPAPVGPALLKPERIQAEPAERAPNEPAPIKPDRAKPNPIKPDRAKLRQDLSDRIDLFRWMLDAETHLQDAVETAKENVAAVVANGGKVPPHLVEEWQLEMESGGAVVRVREEGGETRSLQEPEPRFFQEELARLHEALRLLHEQMGKALDPGCREDPWSYFDEVVGVERRESILLSRPTQPPTQEPLDDGRLLVPAVPSPPSPNGAVDRLVAESSVPGPAPLTLALAPGRHTIDVGPAFAPPGPFRLALYGAAVQRPAAGASVEVFRATKATLVLDALEAFYRAARMTVGAEFSEPKIKRSLGAYLASLHAKRGEDYLTGLGEKWAREARDDLPTHTSRFAEVRRLAASIDGDDQAAELRRTANGYLESALLFWDDGASDPKTLERLRSTVAEIALYPTFFKVSSASDAACVAAGIVLGQSESSWGRAAKRARPDLLGRWIGLGGATGPTDARALRDNEPDAKDPSPDDG